MEFGTRQDASLLKSFQNQRAWPDMDRETVVQVTENFHTAKILAEVSKHETRKMCNITSRSRLHSFLFQKKY